MLTTDGSLKMTEEEINSALTGLNCQRLPGGEPGLIWINDGETHSTLAIESEDLTPEKIERHVGESRSKFATAPDVERIKRWCKDHRRSSFREQF